MADLDKIPVPLYNPLHPYHWEFDNLPLQALILREQVMNGELENNSAILRDAVGTQGTLSNRLNQSINPDGSLKSTAIDKVFHNIADHTDGSVTLTTNEIIKLAALGYVVSNPVPYVRMLTAERDKLSLIAHDATNMTIQVQTPSNVVLFTQGPVSFVPSDTVKWQVGPDNRIQANFGFPVAAAHRHYYDLEPITTDYKNYKVTSVNTPYIHGSLRVYINGVRISSIVSIYVPGHLVANVWTLNSFTPDETNGTFILTNTVTAQDNILIDFDIALA